MTHPVPSQRAQAASAGNRQSRRRARIEQRQQADRRLRQVRAWLRSLGPRRTGLR